MDETSKKGGLGLLIGIGPKPKAEEVEAPVSEDESNPAADIAAEGVFEALKADDMDSFKSALATYVKALKA